MNTKLVQKYVAYKAALHDPIFEEVQQKTTLEHYLLIVLDRPLSEFPQKVREQAAKNIRNRYGLEVYKPLFPEKDMTIAQWARAVCGQYSLDEVMSFFTKNTGFQSDFLKKVKIGSNTISRPHLITLVERLESATGRSLSMPDLRDPLSYLSGNVTIHDIAKYFSANSDVIARFRRRYCVKHRVDDVERQIKLFKQQALEVYRRSAEIDPDIPNEDILSKPLSDFYWTGFAPGDWDLPVYFAADEFDVMLPIPKSAMPGTTTVSELVALMVKSKLQQQKGVH